MITQVQAGPYTIRGISVGGVYTSLYVPELGVMFDVGAPARSFVGASALCLSHGHVDHLGALSSFLGIRALSGKTKPLKVFMPAAIVEHVQAALRAMSAMQRFELEIEAVGLEPGETAVLRGDLHLRAFRTFHPVPSLGYQLVRRVQKLRPEHAGMAGAEIATRRRAGEELFDVIDKPELAYATDTLARVLETEPSILESRVLILECTFLDERKSLAATHAGCHIHLDELLAMADRFRNEQLVLMHFSQIYKPREVVQILGQRCPPSLLSRIVVFAPDRDEWPG